MTVTDQGARYAPIRYEDGFFIGEGKRLQFKVTEEDDVTIPSDLATWTYLWTLKEDVKDIDPIIQVDSAGITVVTDEDPDNPGFDISLVRVTVDRADTLPIKAGTYWHSLVRTDGIWTVLAQGEAVLRYAASSRSPEGS